MCCEMHSLRKCKLTKRGRRWSIIKLLRKLNSDKVKLQDRSSMLNDCKFRLQVESQLVPNIDNRSRPVITYRISPCHTSGKSCKVSTYKRKLRLERRTQGKFSVSVKCQLFTVVDHFIGLTTKLSFPTTPSLEQWSSGSIVGAPNPSNLRPFEFQSDFPPPFRYYNPLCSLKI